MVCAPAWTSAARRELNVRMAAADKPDRGHSQRRWLRSRQAVSPRPRYNRRPARPSSTLHARNRSGAGLPFGTSLAENEKLKNLARPGDFQAYPDALASARTMPRISARAAKSAHGPRAASPATPHASASPLPRRDWYRVYVGNFWRVTASTSANISAGRRPEK